MYRLDRHCRIERCIRLAAYARRSQQPSALPNGLEKPQVLGRPIDDHIPAHGIALHDGREKKRPLGPLEGAHLPDLDKHARLVKGKRAAHQVVDVDLVNPKAPDQPFQSLEAHGKQDVIAHQR